MSTSDFPDDPDYEVRTKHIIILFITLSITTNNEKKRWSANFIEISERYDK